MKEISKNTLYAYIILVLIAVITSTAGLYIGNNIKNGQDGVKIITPSISQYPDYNAIKGENRDQNITSVNMADDCQKDDCVDGQSASIHFGGINKEYKVVGTFSRAYLYIEASVDYNRPLTSWDDIYFTINGMGGHLVSGDDNSLPIPMMDQSTSSSQYLYNLSSISYYPTESNKIQKINENENINLFDLLQNSAQLNASISVVSARPGRVIKDVSIYYECAQGSQCSIQEVKK